MLSQGDISGNMILIQEMLANRSLKKLYVPSFAPLSLKGLNLSHYTALVPVGLTTEVYEHHDGYDMSATILAYHDLWHELFINSGIMSNDSRRSQFHNAIVQCYQSSGQIDPVVLHAAEMILFEHCHENRGKEKGKPLSLLVSGRTCIEKASQVSLRLARDWIDLDECYKSAGNAEHLTKGSLWLSILMQTLLNSDLEQAATNIHERFQEEWDRLEEQAPQTENWAFSLNICRSFLFMGVDIFDEKETLYYETVANQLERYGSLL